MSEVTFIKRLEAIRESIFQGNVSEGAIALSAWLPELKDDLERLEVLLDIILLSLVCNDYEDANKHWKDVQEISLIEEPVRLKAYKGYFLLADGKKRRGLGMLEACILTMPDNYEFYLLRALSYVQNEQFEHAQADLARANALSPNNILVMSILGDVCAELDEVERAISLHETVLESCPDLRRSLMSLGVLYYDKHRMDEAFRIFQCLSAYDPLNWFAWACLGDILSLRPGRTFQSLSYYAAAIAVGADSGSTYLSLAKGLFILGKYAEGIQILKRFEKTGGRWTGDDRRFVRYLKLIADVIEHPEKVRTDEFLSVFHSLKGLCDHGTVMLFQILSATCAYTNSDAIQHVYLSHISVFLYFMQYMQICEHRMIEPEEALMLGVVAHQLIWCGYRYEAMALLMLINRADEARIIDMTNYLWCELYDQSQLANSEGIEVEAFHRQLIRGPQADYMLNMVITGQYRQFANDPQWREALSRLISEEQPNGMNQELMILPYDKTLEQYARHCKRVLKKEEISAGWGLCQSYDLPDFEAIRHRTIAGFSKPGLSCIRDMLSIYQHGKPMIAPNDISAADRIRQAEVGEEDSSYISAGWLLAGNNNVEQKRLPASSEALEYEPWPYAMDGSAFERLLPEFRFESGKLNRKGLKQILGMQVKRALFCMMRARTDARADIGVMQDESLLESYTLRAVDIWYALHGHQKLLPEMLFNPADAQYQAVMDTVFEFSTGYRVIQSDIRSGLFPESGVMLPEMGDDSDLIYYVSRVPAYPRAAQVYVQPLSGQLLSWPDLVEQFFNYAVDVVDNWLSSHSDESLTLLVFPRYRAHFVFRTFDSFAQKSAKVPRKKKYMAHLSVKNPQHHIGHIRALNTDREHRSASSKYSLGLHPRLQNSKNSRIQNVHELGHSLSQMYAKYKAEKSMQILDSFNEGYYHHPFLKQFMDWAKTLASSVYPDIYEIECLLHSQTQCYEGLLWRVNELLRHYPFLSRLYLIRAAIYVRMNAAGKALQALLAGCRWEERLYRGTGWKPIHPDKKGMESALEPVEGGNELEESQPLIWRERYVFQYRDDSLYHYYGMESGFGMRERERVFPPYFLHRIVNGDKGGGFEFYQLFRLFIQANSAFREAYLDGLITPGVHSLRDYMVHVIKEMRHPMYFPLRRQLAEMLYQLYPGENPAPLGRFYCDNIQSGNGLVHAAYGCYSTITSGGGDAEMEADVALGCALYDLGIPEDALEYLNEAVQFQHPSSMAYLSRGCALVETNQFEAAVENLEKGLQMTAGTDRFYYNLGLAYLGLDRLEEAEDRIKTGISMSKLPVDLNALLLRVYVRQGKLLDALPLARYVSEIDPEMFLNTMNFPECEAFSQMPPVKAIIDECSYHRPNPM